MFEYKEKPDRVLEVYRDGKSIGFIKKVNNGWRYMISGQRHVLTPILHSRTEVQKWLEVTNGNLSVSYESTTKQVKE